MNPMIELMLSQVAIAKNLRPNTVKTYAARLSAMNASPDWTVEEAQAAIDAIESINTRNASAIAVRTVLELPVRLGVPVSREWTLPTPEELKEALEGFRFASRAYILAAAGTRLSEACAVTKSSVNGRNLVIDRQVDSHGRLVAPKTKAHVKTVPLWLSQTINEIDSVDSPMAVACALNRLSKKTGLQLNASALRSFHASYLLHGDVDLHSVSAQMGHASIATTSKFYAVANRDKISNVLDNLNPAA